MESGPEHVGNISPFAHAGSSSSTSAHGILSSPDKPWSVAPEAPAAPFGAPTDDYHSGSSTSHSATASSTPIGIKRVGGKSNVSSACAPCKKSHLACDVARPCQRCVAADRPEQCVDVPHKKRGRPKMTKPTRDAYERLPPGAMPMLDGLQSGRRHYYPPGSAPGFDFLPYPPPTATSGSFDYAGPSTYATRGHSPIHSAPDSAMRPMPPPAPPTPFELFCTTDLRIVRASARCQQYTGYQPNQFLGVRLLDFVHPVEKARVEHEFSMLTTVSFLNSPLQTSQEAESLMAHRPDRDLLSPAEGMKEPYPNANVRIIRADNTFAWFNIRLHLGGGLGGSLYQPSSLGSIYIVVSFLYLTHFEEAGRGPYLPPTPLSGPQQGQTMPTTAMLPHYGNSSMSRGLPSFSSFAAAAEAPRAKYEWTEPLAAGQGAGGQPLPSPTMPYSANTARSPYAWTEQTSPTYVKREHSPVGGRQPSSGFAPQPPFPHDDNHFAYNVSPLPQGPQDDSKRYSGSGDGEHNPAYARDAYDMHR